ncbi:YVTN repeat-like/Quino protein amine dehydrogenase [Macrolepiota fuliginosa MF-IS2]|uniref:YVTN repeat-like/Quino protein amine dehydrogenase n=1 Tax=Macrolepiota fuliginosa MF-IS2 TaxID=1400762 RepID=A0A9P5XI18_9AGAR|nr:YVTN repeat-like/Quino protein amine dehydrogenase [Macrolepiota fuliginosa MF-IS2]
MLSITATNVLAVVDPSALKYPPSSLPSCLTPTEEYGASAWATDSALYLSSAQTISRYDLSSNQLKSLYTLEEGHIIRCLLAKDKSSIVFSAGDKAHVLECSGPTAKVVRTFGSHKRDILSLSLSNDSTLLACGLPDGVYVHNLTTGSHTVLRGLPPGMFTIICVFHPYTRTRLLVGYEDQLFVYDTTRPSAPSKVIPLSENGNHVSAIACSPFSKTLVAVAMTDGVVGLVDLDKEKGLFRTVDLKVSLTTIAFSPEGASIYLGTEDGRLLVQDLRALDKPPKSTVVSESGNFISTLAVWKKPKGSPDDTKPKVTPRLSVKNLPGTPVSKPVSSPMRQRIARTSTASATPLKALFKAGKPKQSPLSRTADPKKVLSPARDPHGNSPGSLTATSVAKSATVRTRKSTSISSASPNLKPRSSSAKAALISESSARRATSAIRAQKPSTTTEPTEPTFATHLETTTTVSEAISSISSARNRIRSRATSSVSLAPSDSAPVISSRPVRTDPSASSSSATSRRKRTSPTEPVPSVPPIPSDFISNLRSTSPVAKFHNDSRTPSPDLPDMRTDPVTPIPPQIKKKGMAVLGMGTPEVKAWMKAGAGTSVQNRQTSKGKGRTKSVGFKDGSGPEDESGAEEMDGPKSDEDGEYEREKSLSLQISPHRPLPTSTSSHQSHGPSVSWDASPLHPRHSAHVPGMPTTGSAHELLKTIVTDVMYDFQRETKAEMMGLHLDLVRMGRGWRQELRTLMEEYVGDLTDLREENRRLREENEKLRRGY